MQLKHYTRNIVIMAAVALISVGCGGGGSSDGAGTDPGFSDNLSGVWNGAITPTTPPGPPAAMQITINQPVSGSVVSTRNATVGLTGTVILAGSGSFAMTGTKDGNSVTMQITSGPATLTMTGALSSENNMNGDYTITGGPSVATGNWFVTR